jgi:hypothetical protein
MSDILLGTSIIIAAAALFVALDSLSIFKYSIDQTGVRVRLFGIPMGSVPFEEISSVEVTSLWDLFWDGTIFRAATTGRRTFRNNVVIFRKSRPPFIIGPSDPVAFRQDLFQQLAARGGAAQEGGRLTSA